jgi:antitoxin (DNA-binding transcriptional repressor) of toxin-antitoxin stability system
MAMISSEEARSGRLSVVTKHGEPIFLAVPFDGSLLLSGLAPRLRDEEAISFGQSARFAGMDVTEFLELRSRLKIHVRPGRVDLEQELQTFN